MATHDHLRPPSAAATWPALARLVAWEDRLAASAALLWRGWIHYRVRHQYRRMPLLLGLALVTLFIWFAENAGTFARAWVFPHQAPEWAMVGPGKLGAWSLLMLISDTLVATVHGVAPARQHPRG